MSPLRVVSVASEIYPVIKTGGLADVAGALPMALKAEGIEMRSLVPGYPAVMKALDAAEEVLALPNFHGGPARVLSGSERRHRSAGARRRASLCAAGKSLYRARWRRLAR